ncbi:SMC-Scp complex subunit ScpB [Agathobaculum sp.]|uniref:SMC-Scp complex subunit ScpB n=1 Tax=Agathobaculum sp. TaxID=2048138 RepID=UPI0026725401|nr:SMC-Scp complex subunit ScpB [uncultured Agathobaculum sp.]
MTQLESTLEAVLFAAGDAVSIDRLCEVLELPRETVLEAARELSSRYDFEQRGLMLRRIADKLQLCSRPMYAEAVRRVTETRKNASLSPAALEVLTIIAYRQPVTRAFIDQLRGVDSGGTLSSLAEKQMIEEAGRLEVPGRPILYRTTEHFLQAFALESLDDLPALPAFTDNEQLSFDMEDEPPDPAPLLRTGKE